MSSVACAQEIFDRAEALMDHLEIAIACLGALEAALLLQGAAPAPVAAAIRRYLEDVRTEADAIARLTMDWPEG